METDGRRGPWCTECGSPGTPRLASIDPNRPIGRCSRGCSRVGGVSRAILTYLAAERLDAQRRWHRRRSTANHHNHHRDGLVSPYCDHCNQLGWAYPPAEPGTDAAPTPGTAVQPEGGP